MIDTGCGGRAAYPPGLDVSRYCESPMARQRIRAMALTVVWDCGRQTFTVLDEDGAILGQSAEHPKAVALAVQDAKTLRLIGVRASVFSKRPNGKLRHEWTDKSDA